MTRRRQSPLRDGGDHVEGLQSVFELERLFPKIFGAGERRLERGKEGGKHFVNSDC